MIVPAHNNSTRIPAVLLLHHPSPSALPGPHESNQVGVYIICALLLLIITNLLLVITLLLSSRRLDERLAGFLPPHHPLHTMLPPPPPAPNMPPSRQPAASFPSVTCEESVSPTSNQASSLESDATFPDGLINYHFLAKSEGTKTSVISGEGSIPFKFLEEPTSPSHELDIE